VGIREDRGGFGEEGGEVLVAGGKVGQDELLGLGLGGDGGGLGGGEVVVFAGEVAVGLEVGAFAEEEVGFMGDFEGGIAREGIGDVGEDESFLGLADLVEADGLAVDGYLAFGFEFANQGAFNAHFFELGCVKLVAWMFGYPPTDIFDSMVKEIGFDAEVVIFEDEPFFADGVFDDFDDRVVAAAVAEAVEVDFASGGVVAVDGVGNFV